MVVFWYNGRLVIDEAGGSRFLIVGSSHGTCFGILSYINYMGFFVTMFSKKVVKVGNLYLGGKNKIYVQSMLNKPSGCVEENVVQAKELEAAGCEIIRLSVLDMQSLNIIFAIKSNIKIPIIADIHFDYKLAIESVYAGADKIRINPGNMGNKQKTKEIVNACKQKNVPIRIGINSGSIPKQILQQYNSATPDALVQTAKLAIELLNAFDFDDIVVSVKSSDVFKTIKAYNLLSSICDYPLHLGVTESGTYEMGLVKSSIGIGNLLLNHIGDTIRVSLTDDPLKEVEAGFNILKALHLADGVDIISCPTCGRTRINVKKIVEELKKEIKFNNLTNFNIKLAVMGCVVNGPGESKEADFGITGGNGEGIIFKKGEVVKKVDEKNLVCELVKLLKEYYRC